MAHEESIQIAYVLDHLALRGAQRFLTHLVQGLAARQYRQEVFCLNDTAHPDIVQALHAAGATVQVIGKRRLLSARGLLMLIRRWRVNPPQIVFTMLPFGDAIGRTCAKLAAVPVIISSIRGKYTNKTSLHFCYNRLTARWAKAVIFNSPQCIPFAMQYEGIQQEQIVCIHNGVAVPPAELLAAPVTAATRRELGISPGTLLIGTVGRLHPDKGYTSLLRAFHDVHRQFPQSILLIVGRGDLQPTLEACAQQFGVTAQVRFLGERTDAPAILAALDVYVQTSLFEGMSNALMEALALGKPVVATAVGGTLELIEDGRTGWLVPPENPARVAECVGAVLRQPELARQVGAAAAAKMARDFSMARMVAGYDRVFRTFATAPKSEP